MKQAGSDKWVYNKGEWLHHSPSVSVPLDGHLSWGSYSHSDGRSTEACSLPSRRYIPGREDKDDLGFTLEAEDILSDVCVK